MVGKGGELDATHEALALETILDDPASGEAP
jgi:hypothetical protein